MVDILSRPQYVNDDDLAPFCHQSFGDHNIKCVATVDCLFSTTKDLSHLGDLIVRSLTAFCKKDPELDPSFYDNK